jgi:membrane protein involved in colicin uptake
MLSSLRTTVKNKPVPFGRIVSGAAAVLMSASLIAPAMAHQQESERQTRELSQATGMHHDQLSVYDSIVRDRLEREAKATLTGAQATVAANQAKADASAAKTAIAGLTDFTKLGDTKLRNSIDTAKTASDALAAAGAEADRRAAAAAAKAAADAAAALAAANTPAGAKSVAASLAASQYGWGDDQFQCLDKLWQRESGWNYQASNSGSGATGIPQALPGNKMATFGSDWATNATTQIKWGLDYISRGYGTPCSAWGHSESVNWY